MKKDVKWMKGRLEELRRMDMRMWKLCEPNSGEQRHFDGRLAAIEEALEFIDNLDEEPYNIQELIHDYEYKTGTFDWATALRRVLRDESEETEVKKDKEHLRSVIQRRIDNLPSTYEGLYIEGSRDAYELVLRDINELDELEVLPQGWVDEYKRINNNRIYSSSDGVTREYIHTDKLETLVVPTDLGEWLQSRRIGDSGVYFSTIDTLYHYWENVISSSTDSFIKDNKKELIEVILGSREYEVEEPLYHALIKGHEVSNSCDIYWNYDKYDNDVFVSRLYPSHDNFLTEMSKEDWNELGINDSNAEFIKV